MKDTDMSATEADATKSTKHEENWQANFLALSYSCNEAWGNKNHI